VGYHIATEVLQYSVTDAGIVPSGFSMRWKDTNELFRRRCTFKSVMEEDGEIKTMHSMEAPPLPLRESVHAD
jgi:hypothetical protein